MRNIQNPAVGKITNYIGGSGFTEETAVEQRASEIARIEGHRAVSKADRRQAHLELNGGDIAPVGDEDADGTSALSRDPSEPASNPGRQIANWGGEDEQYTTERLVAEGVNEAEHNQMLAARKRKRG
jgi:hypothetical protein